jgi:hypothetical protein
LQYQRESELGNNMANYVASNANRFYVALEGTYGQASIPAAANRFPAVKLQAGQVLETSKRLDKTGTRTFLGTPKDARRRTAYEVRSYLTSWSGTGLPSYGPLFQAALGAAPALNSGLIVASVASQTQFQTTNAHGLSVGSGVAFGNEIRFVSTVPDGATVIINVPFSTALAPGAALAPAVTYRVATALPSVSLYDYWDPASTISRIVTGAAVDTCVVTVNGDFHEFGFSGPAADLLDSNTFTAGSAGLTGFPAEPDDSGFDYSIVPGHLGQVWLGSTPTQMFTLTSATVEIKNNLVVRNAEFGSSYPSSITPGERDVTSQFTLMAQNDAQTTALYAAARLRNPVSAMLQLGQQQGQLMGILLPNVVPEIPSYNDSQPRLQWEFKNNRAQGVSDDEIFVAFA